MKHSTFVILIVAVMCAAPAAWARIWSSARPSWKLEPTDMVGSFRCEEKIHEIDHRKDHDCDLRLVNEENGEVWNIKDDPALSALHQKYGGPVRVKVAAMSSPRFLLGGSFLKVKAIEVLDSKLEDSKVIE